MNLLGKLIKMHWNIFYASLFFAEIQNVTYFPWIDRLTHDVIPEDIVKECAIEQEKCTCVKGV